MKIMNLGTRIMTMMNLGARIMTMTTVGTRIMTIQHKDNNHDNDDHPWHQD